MSTSTFPTSLDTYTNPTATNTTNSPSLSAGQTLQNDSLAALEAKVGITNSTVPTSLDYKVSNLITYAQTIQNDTGSANAHVLTPTPALTSYSAGQKFNFYPGNANTGAATLNVNGLGTKAIQYGGAALQAGWLLPTTMAVVIYDGTAFQLVNQAYGAWTTYAPAVTGFSSYSVSYAAYQITGKTIVLALAVSGTSNATSFGASLPFNAFIGQNIGPFRATDNGTNAFTGLVTTTGGSTALSLYNSAAGGGWTASGSKGIEIYTTIQLA